MGTRAVLCRVAVQRLPKVSAISTESQLIAAAKRGQSEALNLLFQKHSDAIFWATFRITKQREDAEDAVQDSMLRAFLHIRDFDERSKFATWLTRIAINSALMILRKKRSAHEIPEESLLDHKLDMDSPMAIRAMPNPEQSYVQAQKTELLKEGIRRLRPAIRTALEIRELQEHSVKETAKILGISVPATKARIFHAKRILGKALRRKVVARPIMLRVPLPEVPIRLNRRQRNKFPRMTAA
jgi:RNA polymerase sigma-70 factor (ECF subfamily)